MPDCQAYKWNTKDKFIYFLVMIPFLVGFIGSLILMARITIFLPIIVIILVLAINIFQAGCCVGCPYRGKYCPALFGVYLGNVFSTWFYKEREFEQKFFERNANIAETLLGVVVIFTGYFLWSIDWIYAVAYVLLAVIHFMLFMVFICPKCSYNETCPGGIAWRACRVWLDNKS